MGHPLSAAVMKLLERKGLSYREMAEIVSVHPSEVSRIKAGTRKWTLSQLELLAEHFEIPLSVLLLEAARDLNDYQLNAELRYYLEKAIEELDRISAQDQSHQSVSAASDAVRVKSSIPLRPQITRVRAIDIPA